MQDTSIVHLLGVTHPHHRWAVNLHQLVLVLAHLVEKLHRLPMARNAKYQCAPLVLPRVAASMGNP